MKLKRNNKLNKIYYSETGLVVRSQTDKTIIGRMTNNEKDFISLDEEAVQLCKKAGLEYDESLLKKEESEEEEEEEEKVSKPKSSHKKKSKPKKQEEEESDEEKEKEKEVTTTYSSSLPGLSELTDAIHKLEQRVNEHEALIQEVHSLRETLAKVRALVQ